MKKFTQFLKDNKDFIKKMIVFFLAYFAISIANSPELTSLLKMIFGDFFVNGISAATTTMFLTMEV